MSKLISTIERTSLRQTSLFLGINYNQFLKIAKSPIVGQVYDPNAINVVALEKFVKRVIGDIKFDNLNWEECEGKIQVVSTSLIKELKVGMRFKLRDNSINTINYLNEGYVVFTSEDATKPQVMSFATFEHQGPKLIK